MTDIKDASLYKVGTVRDYPCSIKYAHPGLRVFNRNTQKMVVTTEDLCYVVTGPAGEREVYNENGILEGFNFTIDEKKKKKLLKGKVFKITARPGTGKVMYLRIPPEERFVVYDEVGVIQGNVVDFTVDHADGDCVICPALADNTPDLEHMSMMNGKVFKERYEL